MEKQEGIDIHINNFFLIVGIISPGKLERVKVIIPLF
jgi:hypothetical protein